MFPYKIQFYEELINPVSASQSQDQSKPSQTTTNTAPQSPHTSPQLPGDNDIKTESGSQKTNEIISENHQYAKIIQERRKEALQSYLMDYYNDLYQQLEVFPTASKEDIHKSFKRLSLVHRRNRDINKKQEGINCKSTTESNFSQILNAYRILSSENLRKIYDNEGYSAFQIIIRQKEQV